MALIQPSGPSWAYCSHNLPADLLPTGLGVSCTAGLSNADGSAVQLLPALGHDVEYLSLRMNAAVASTQNNNVLMDLLIDPAGGSSWSVLIEDLIAGGMAAINLSNQTVMAGPVNGYDFPIWIPAGASLGIQARSAASSTAPVLTVLAYAKGGNRNPASWWCGQRVSTINAVPSTSNGGTHTPGVHPDYSSWTDFGSPIGAACGALQWGVGGENDTAWGASFAYQQFEFGVGGERIDAPVWRTINASENGAWLPTGPIFRQLAAGTQLQVRAITTLSPAGAQGVTAYAVH